MRRIPLSIILIAFLSIDPSTLISQCGGEKILFFFGGGTYSHKHSVWPWATALADRDHNVTFISPYDKAPSKNHPRINDLSSPLLYKLMSKSYHIDKFQQRERGEEHELLTDYSKISIDICATTLLKSGHDAAIQRLLNKEENFDLVIINIVFGECGFFFAHLYNAKIIVFDSTVPLPWFLDVYGIQSDSSWIPDITMKYDNMPMSSVVKRLKNAYWSAYSYYDRYNYMSPQMDAIAKQAFPRDNIPPFHELERNISLLILNSHHSFDFAFSLPPYIIQIGGINAYLPEKEIPEKYEKFMDGAGPDGVVLISFGSSVPLEKVAPYYIKIFFEVIKRHKNARFLLKWSGPYPSGYDESGLDNLLSSDWLPQREILRHPKLAAFITHGGLNSIQEATFYGVPMIVLPLFADQDYNAYRIQEQQVGFRLEIRELTFPLMDEALSKILGDKRYKNNMKIKSSIFRDRPQNPLETAIFWTEFVLRNNDVSALKPMNSNLSWYQRRLLDVYAVVVIIIASLLLILFGIILKLGKRFCSTKDVAASEKKLKKS